MTELRFETLKERHRACRDAQPPALAIRIHRALSWLKRSEKEQDDPDAQFIFLWIALNAAYATEFGDEKPQLEQFRQFVAKLLRHDPQGRLHKALFDQFTGPIRNIFENKYLYQPFWDGLRRHDSTEAWKTPFEGGRANALKALMEQRTLDVTGLLCSRLYVLRNQLIHGGATHSGDLNRDALRDANRVLGTVVPIIIDLLIPLQGEEFGELAYPPN